MLKIVNDPIYLFVEFINRAYPSKEEVVVLLVDEDIERTLGLLDNFALADKGFENQPLGCRLKNLRMLKGWSRPEMATLVGVSVSTIKRWENNFISTTAEKTIRRFFKEMKDDAFLGRYWRQTEEPHVILVSNGLSILDTVSVLSHEYVHHLLWREEMLDMADIEVHNLPEFAQKWDEVSGLAYKFIETVCAHYGFADKE